MKTELISKKTIGNKLHQEYLCPCGANTILEVKDLSSENGKVNVTISCCECSNHYIIRYTSNHTSWDLYHDYTTYFEPNSDSYKGEILMSYEKFDFFYIQNYVDKQFNSKEVIDHEKIANKFVSEIHKIMDDERFENLLIITGFIPDLYPNDSSEETLFTKLVEGIVSEWAKRVGAVGDLIKQKASYEDIRITFDDKIIVCDAKSFRLGRSQQAPNAKDFLKLEDIRKWKSRYPTSIGGLVAYPCKHEWAKSSDIYQYCSTKDAPTVMLPYKYLAYLLHYKDNFTPKTITNLWDYESLFPQKFTKDIPGGNKVKYWEVINAEICKITNTSIGELNDYMINADKLIDRCVAENLSQIQAIRQNIVDRIVNSIEKDRDIESIKKRLIDYQIKTETELIDKIIKRIIEFR